MQTIVHNNNDMNLKDVNVTILKGCYHLNFIFKVCIMAQIALNKKRALYRTKNGDSEISIYYVLARKIPCTEKNEVNLRKRLRS